MPYVVRKGDGETYEVVNKDSNQVKAVHQPPDAKEKAERQVKLLEAIEHDPNWEMKDGSD